jgi:hypothetical protein
MLAKRNTVDYEEGLSADRFLSIDRLSVYDCLDGGLLELCCDDSDEGGLESSVCLIVVSCSKVSSTSKDSFSRIGLHLLDPRSYMNPASLIAILFALVGGPLFCRVSVVVHGNLSRVQKPHTGCCRSH